MAQFARISLCLKAFAATLTVLFYIVYLEVNSNDKSLFS